MTLRCFNPREVRLASLLIAGLELIWAWFVYFDGGGRLSLMLWLYGAREEFAAIMLVSALMILAGCAFPFRKIRHFGLWITALVSFATFGFMAGNAIYGLMFSTLPFVGFMALVVYVMDSMGKPREKVDC